MGETLDLPLHQKQKSSIDIFRGGDPNCVGYALYALHIVPFEAEVGLEVIDPLFEPVESPEEAEAVAAGRVDERGRMTYSHIAVIDKKLPGYVIQRAGTGENVRTLPLETAFQDYTSPYHPEDKYELVYLKKRDPDSVHVTVHPW